MATLLLKGEKEDYYIKEESIVALTVDKVTEPGSVYRVRVRTSSGQELGAYFDSAEEQLKFVHGWTGKVTDLRQQPRKYGG